MASLPTERSSTLSCTNCGRANPPDSIFCNYCGANLGAARATREERKLISVLFVDLVGFTARSDKADPEDVREDLELYYVEAKRRVEQYGGTLEKFIGDAIMAVFGAPIAHGDDAERAVRAGLSVLEGILELNEKHDLNLAARGAVNTGEAVVTVQSDEASDALAIGDVVNTASRLQNAAPTGRLIVGTETHRATRHTIRYEELEPVTAKGKADAVGAWLAVEPILDPAQRPSGGHELIGRDGELDLMESFWNRSVEARRPHLITVVGPPGIGKSRLCLEISQRVTNAGGRLLTGRCLPYAEQGAYPAFSRIVREASDILGSEPAQTAREKLQATVERLMPAAEAADAFRYLALLLGWAPDDDVNEPRLLFFAARRFLESLGIAQPTVFLWEDIHWAQSSEIDLLEYLGQHLRDAPVMLLVTARPELLDERPTWGSGLLAHTAISLDPLTVEDAGRLASQILGPANGKALDPAQIIEVAGGNPLFLEELAASLAEVGGSDAIPVTVREAIAARIDAIPTDARNALLSAAVVGRTFWSGVLDAISGGDHIDDALGVLEARDLVRREPTSQLSGDIEFTFKHIVIWEVAYATVPRASRRERHGGVARYIEETIEGSAESLSTVLAYHWRQAGEPERAIPYLLASADAARRSWAREAAIDFYSAALELSDDDELKRKIRLQRGLALVELEDFERAADELGELLPELQGPQKLDALIGRGHATLWTERDAETLAIAEEALSLATELGDNTGVPAALALKSEGLAMRGGEGDIDLALELGDRALETWVPGARSYDRADHLHLHADCTYWAGRYDRCIDLSREARASARDVHSAEALLRGGGTEALSLAALGHHEQAIALWDDLFELARELGHSRRVLLNYSSLAYRELLDLDEARRRSEEALELSAAYTFGMPRQFAGSDLLFTQLLERDIGGAQASWPRLWEGAEHATAWTTWLIVGRLATARAEIALRAESPESALEWAHRAVELAQRTRRRKYEARSLTFLGEALGAMGRRDEALSALRAAVEVADELIGPPGRWQARAALGRMAYALGDDDAAAAAYAEAGDLIESFAGTLKPERSARYLAAPSVAETLALSGRRGEPPVALS